MPTAGCMNDAQDLKFQHIQEIQKLKLYVQEMQKLVEEQELQHVKEIQMLVEEQEASISKELAAAD